VVVGVEAIVGELDADQHSLPAVVLEPGMVRPVVDRVVVRVDNVQVQLVLSRRAHQRHHQVVRTVAVLAVMDVDAIARLAAVADHVHLEDADDVGLRSGALIAVLVAAVQPLLLAREVDEADGVAQLVVLQSASDFHDADGAGSIVIGAGSDVLHGPRAANGRVEVPGHDDDLGGVGRAENLSLDVVIRLAAHLVGDALDGDAERLVVVLDVGQRQLEILAVAVARTDGHRLASDDRSLLTREDVQVFGDAGDGHTLVGSQDARVLSGQVAGVDLRLRKEARALLLNRVELATAASVLAVVHGMEFSGVGLEVGSIAVLVTAAAAVFTMVVTVVVAMIMTALRRIVGPLAKSHADEHSRERNETQNREDYRIAHSFSPCADLSENLCERLTEDQRVRWLQLRIS